MKIIEKLKNIEIKKIMFLLVIVYLISRIFFAYNFVAHNDEVIYTQYAQLINENPIENYSISYDGRMYGDVKDPFQYWFSAIFINLFQDSIFSMRICAIIFGFLGFFFGLKLFDKFSENKYGKILFGLFYIFCPYFIYFDSVAVSEVFVYGLGTTYLYFLFQSLDFIKENGKTSIKYFFIVVILFLLTILSKLSGMIYMIFGLGIIILYITKYEIKERNIIIKFFITYFGTFILGFFIHNLLNINSNSGTAVTSNVANFSEILKFPILEWFKNAGTYFSEILFPSYSYVGILLIFVLLILNFVKTYKSSKKSFIILSEIFVLFLISFFIIAILMNGGGFIRHKGMFIYFFIFLTTYLILEINKYTTKKYLGVVISIFLILISSFNGIKNIYSYGLNNIGYKETPGGWASGLGTKELLNELKKLPPGLLIADGQWGIPGTFTEVYGKNYLPNLVIKPFDQDFLNNNKKVIDLVKSRGMNFYMVLDNGRTDRNLKFITESDLCKNNEIFEKKYPGVEIKNSKIILCKY